MGQEPAHGPAGLTALPCLGSAPDGVQAAPQEVTSGPALAFQIPASGAQQGTLGGGCWPPLSRQDLQMKSLMFYTQRDSISVSSPCDGAGPSSRKKAEQPFSELRLPAPS